MLNSAFDDFVKLMSVALMCLKSYYFLILMYVHFSINLFKVKKLLNIK